MAGAFFNIANLYTQENKIIEAKPYFEKAAAVFKDILMRKYKEMGHTFETEPSHEQLMQPSAFDTSEEIKELKVLFSEMIENFKEAEKNSVITK